jgi:peptidoglycan hydrolase CwlO-like protein
MIIDFNLATLTLETSMFLSDQPRNAFFAQMWDRDSSPATLSAIDHSQQNLQAELSRIKSDFERFKQRGNRKVCDMYKKVSELELDCQKLHELIESQNKTIESLQSIDKGEQAAPVKPSAK